MAIKLFVMGVSFIQKRRQIAYMYSNIRVYCEIVITSQTSDCRIFAGKAIFGPRLRQKKKCLAVICSLIGKYFDKIFILIIFFLNDFKVT